MAQFTCVLCLVPPLNQRVGDNALHLNLYFFEGECAGRLLEQPRGSAGFGYDPLFVPEGFEQTFAELGADAKNGISHRARAWAKLAAWLKNRSGGPAVGQ